MGTSNERAPDRHGRALFFWGLPQRQVVGGWTGPSAGSASSRPAVPVDAAEYAPNLDGGCFRFGAPSSPPLTPISSSKARSRSALSAARSLTIAPVTAPTRPPTAAPA